VSEVIDKGLPALAIGEETDLVTGHFHDHLVARTADCTEEGYSALTKWPFSFLLPVSRRVPIPPAQQIREGLEAAVADWNADEPFDGYWTGRRAYADWRSKLAESVVGSVDADKRWQNEVGNAYIMEGLVDARRSAALFLHRVENMMGPEAKKELLAAAAVYERMLELLNNPTFRAYAPYPWDCDEENVWDEAKRQDHIARLHQAEELDAEAIGHLERALQLYQATH
jgi:hypothetical protein